MPQEARDDGDRLTGVIEQFDREVSRALPATATHPHRGLPRIADPPIVERPPDGIVAPTGLLTRPAVRHPATSSTQPTVHIRIDIVFALFDLLGRRFLPRLRDLPDQRLYRLGPPHPDLAVDVARRGKIRDQLITDRWDDLLRAAGSLKRGWIAPSLLISRLQAQSPKTPLTAALQEYGRLVKTNFALSYHADPLQRRRITAMLNKGETTNTLRRRIAFANRHQLRHDTDPDQHAACLTLILNAIIVWNTRYIQAAVDRIRATRPELVNDQALARLAPVLHAHINPYYLEFRGIREGVRFSV